MLLGLLRLLGLFGLLGFFGLLGLFGLLVIRIIIGSPTPSAACFGMDSSNSIFCCSKSSSFRSSRRSSSMPNSCRLIVVECIWSGEKY